MCYTCMLDLAKANEEQVGNRQPVSVQGTHAEGVSLPRLLFLCGLFCWYMGTHLSSHCSLEPPEDHLNIICIHMGNIRMIVRAHANFLVPRLGHENERLIEHILGSSEVMCNRC